MSVNKKEERITVFDGLHSGMLLGKENYAF